MEYLDSAADRLEELNDDYGLKKRSSSTILHLNSRTETPIAWLFSKMIRLSHLPFWEICFVHADGILLKIGEN